MIKERSNRKEGRKRREKKVKKEDRQSTSSVSETNPRDIALLSKSIRSRGISVESWLKVTEVSETISLLIMEVPP
jgi:hypothetical protein